MARLQAPGMVLILWQGLSLMPGLAEFVYDRPAPLTAVLASTVLALGWLGLAAWAGSRGAAEFYQTAGRLATEHALLDDNGDGLGTPADWFRGVRATKQARDGASLDGSRAQRFALIRSPAEQALPPALRARRDELEGRVELLRARKASLPEEDYYRQLEELLLDLAQVYPPAPANP